MSDHNIRRFTAYRPLVAEKGNHTHTQMNAPEEVQYEGVVFSDGSCALRWRTAVNSTSLWASFEDAMEIHGHPEYGTRIVFHDEPIPLPWEQQEEDVPEEVYVIQSLLEAILGREIPIEVVSAAELRKKLSE
jgi:hypothetical protein